MWKIFYCESDSQILISTSILNFRCILFSFFTLFKNQKRWQDKINTQNTKNLVISRLYAYISKLVECHWTIIYNSPFNYFSWIRSGRRITKNLYFPIPIFSFYCSPIHKHAISVFALIQIWWPSPITVDDPFNISLLVLIVIAIDPINIRFITDY